jgi:uncharacterized membrane protein
MDILGPFHPSIVHFPIVLILVAALFELVGRATDLAWWRKAAFAMLVLGTVAAWAAVWSGRGAEDPAEDQGVSHDAIHEHEDAGKIAAWLALGAVAVRAVAGRLGRAAPAAGALGLLLHLLAASAIGVAGYRGGRLVFEHGAGVRVGGELVSSEDDEEDDGEEDDGEEDDDDEDEEDDD